MLNIPTKINKGTVEITTNVALIKAGDKVGASEATLLAKLGIKPFSYGLIVKYVSCRLSSSSKWLLLYLSSFTGRCILMHSNYLLIHTRCCLHCCSVFGWSHAKLLPSKCL